MSAASHHWQGRARHRPFAVCLVLLLAGCAAGPDGTGPLADPSAALADTAAVQASRMAPSLAGTPFGQSVAAAVEGYPSLAAGLARMQAAQAAIAGEAGAFRPQIGLGAEASVQLSGGDRSSRATPLLTVSQLVYDGGVASARTRAAEAQLAQAGSDRMATAAALTLQAVEIWHEVLHRRRMLDLAARNVTLHREFLAQTQERVDAGAASETDLLTAQSRLADATARRVGAQSRLERAEAAFLEVYGRPPGALPAPAAAPSLPAEATATLDSSPRLRSLDAALAAAQAEAEAARAGQRPSVIARLTGGARDGRPDVGATLGLQYDLDTAGRRQAAVTAAEARFAEVAANRDTLRREIARALDVVRSDQRAGAARLQSARVARRANEANVDAVREQFGIGRRSISELLDAQRDFLTASEALLEAELELAVAGYAALALTGDILDVFGIRMATLAATRPPQAP